MAESDQSITVHEYIRVGNFYTEVKGSSGIRVLYKSKHEAWNHCYRIPNTQIHLALLRRYRRENNPRAKVCQNHPVAFLGSTFFAKNQAYTASPKCNAIAITKTSRITSIERKTNRWMSSTHFNGPTGGRQAAENTASIPIVTANQVNMVGPSSSLLFRFFQYEIVAAKPSWGLTIGT